MNPKSKCILAALLLFIIVSGCRKKEEPVPYSVSNTSFEPHLTGVVDYPQSHNDRLATLGRVLFYERELSSNRNISCGSCHQQAKAFADGNQFSLGTNEGFTKRNSPSI